MKRLTRKESGSPPLKEIKTASGLVSDSEDLSRLCAAHFFPHDSHLSPNNIAIKDSADTYISSFSCKGYPITCQEILSTLSALYTNFSPGPDGIPFSTFLAICPALLPSLCVIFSSALT